MDLSFLQDMIPDLASALNVEPATLLLYLGLIATGCNIIGRLIPDDKVGALGTIRDICKFIGVYTPNRVASGISVNDVARSIVSKADPEVVETAVDADALIPQIVDNSPNGVTPAFPGLTESGRLGRDPKTGRFVPRPPGEAI